MKRFLVSALTVAAMAVGSSRAEAAILTLIDTDGGSNTIWTLNVATGCQTCAVTLSAFFQDPAGAAVNAYTGQFLESVQWNLTSPNVAPTSAANIGFQTTNAGVAANWQFFLGNTNNNSCSASPGNDSTCGDWIGGGTPDGFGPIVNGSTLTWTFNTTFASALPATITSGNIRASFNTPQGGNYNIFSPGGGTFQGQGTPVQGQGTPVQGQGQPQQGSPEPASLLLFGAALTAAGMRLRRVRA